MKCLPVLYLTKTSILEVKKAVESAKCGKAVGFDGIPVEVLKNDTTVIFLYILFNICSSSGGVPSIWGKLIINPIPKASTNAPRDTLSYRSIYLHHLCIKYIALHSAKKVLHT